MNVYIKRAATVARIVKENAERIQVQKEQRERVAKIVASMK